MKIVYQLLQHGQLYSECDTEQQAFDIAQDWWVDTCEERGRGKTYEYNGFEIVKCDYDVEGDVVELEKKDIVVYYTHNEITHYERHR